MTENQVMEHVTTVGAVGAVSAPLWVTELNPYIQLVAGVLGIVWLGVQIYCKLTHKDKS
jgi:hypothetical protein